MALINLRQEAFIYFLFSQMKQESTSKFWRPNDSLNPMMQTAHNIQFLVGYIYDCKWQ